MRTKEPGPLMGKRESDTVAAASSVASFSVKAPLINNSLPARIFGNPQLKVSFLPDEQVRCCFFFLFVLVFRMAEAENPGDGGNKALIRSCTPKCGPKPSEPLTDII